MDHTTLSQFDTAFWLTCGGIVVLLLFSAFFSGSETALTAASRGKLRSQADKGSKGAQLALEITEDNEKLIGSVLLGNNLVNILATSLATALFTRVFGDGGVALATLVMTALVLIFAEVLPKTYALRPADRVALAVAPIMRLTRASIINVLSNDYIEMAHLKGMSPWRVITRHALPNAVAPIVNVTLMITAQLIVGVIVIETLFSYRGMGSYMVESVALRDLPVVQACGMIFCMTYVALNLVADLLSILSNPRLRLPK